MMLRSLAQRVARNPTVAKRAFSEAAKMSLSVTAPHEAICFQEPVESVTLPGAAGEYGVTAGHSPLVEELKPGVVAIVRAPGDAPEKYFVSGGFAFTDPEKTDVSVMEAIKLDDLDADKVKAEFAKAKATLDAATDDDAKAEATLALDALKTMATALNVTV
mmetsp:Transcript_23794/g.73229  ORF Transcript_23794/g.73229 Transcript_23794/m.73229 type:complete len:161 (+) Transcript_23794:54-536(+)|eukprot:CAMPEP_0198651760 /NCGR_PEP_ID=MMETSP1467-20131203/5903_1 /TAXON_ID=1462469 /ORGANISM="unid. sp., Strain CCMP2135" /LENGTH=160 /DNA_ID=CAMNT_0044387663 /DNA_START=54 /DNA_END=536 /DNA_ORIENTATION=-